MWNLIVLDLCLYGTHELLHHKIFVHPLENFFSLLSLGVAIVGLVLVLFELNLILRYIHKFYYKLESYIISDLASSRGSATTRLLSHYDLVELCKYRI